MSNKIEEAEQKRMPPVTSDLRDDSKGQITNRPSLTNTHQQTKHVPPVTSSFGDDSKSQITNRAPVTNSLDNLINTTDQEIQFILETNPIKYSLSIHHRNDVEPIIIKHLEIPNAEEALAGALANNPLYQKTIRDINQLVLDKIKFGKDPGLPVGYDCDPTVAIWAYRGIEPCVRVYYEQRGYKFGTGRKQSSKDGPFDQFVYYVHLLKH